jgi:hypothetical protein
MAAPPFEPTLAGNCEMLLAFGDLFVLAAVLAKSTACPFAGGPGGGKESS